MKTNASPKTRPRAQRRKWWFRLITPVLALGLLAILTEALLGSWFFGASDLWFLNIPRNMHMQRNASALYEGGGVVDYRRDRHGLRGDYETPSDIDILAIGGSTTDERFVEEEHTWVAVLAGELAGAGHPMTVVNAGIDGHSSIGHIRSLEKWFPRIPGLRPCFVIAYVGINDVQVEAYERWDAIEIRDSWQRSVQALKSNSALVQLLRRFRRVVGPRIEHGGPTPEGPFEFDVPDRSGHSQLYADRLESYGQRLKRMNEMIRNLDAIPIFVTQPRGNYRVVDGRVKANGNAAVDAYQSLRLFNEKTMEVCAAVDAICIDLSNELRFEDGDHYDANHTSPRGSEKIGRFLAGYLVRNAILTECSTDSHSGIRMPV